MMASISELRRLQSCFPRIGKRLRGRQPTPESSALSPIEQIARFRKYHSMIPEFPPGVVFGHLPWDVEQRV